MKLNKPALTTLAICLALCLGGCETYSSPPIIDYYMPQSGSAYQQDLAQCQMVAGQEDVGYDAAAEGLLQGLGGLFQGFVAGALTDNSFQSAIYGGILNATAGIIGGAQQGVRNRAQIVKNCLTLRAYRVVN